MSEAESSSTYRRGLLIDSEIRILTDFNTTFFIFFTSKQQPQGQVFSVWRNKSLLIFLPTHDLIFIFFRVRKCWRSFTLSFISSPRWGGFLLRTPHRSHVLCLKERTSHNVFPHDYPCLTWPTRTWRRRADTGSRTRCRTRRRSASSRWRRTWCRTCHRSRRGASSGPALSSSDHRSYHSPCLLSPTRKEIIR